MKTIIGAAKHPPKKAPGRAMARLELLPWRLGAEGRPVSVSRSVNYFLGKLSRENVKLLISVTKVYDHCYPRRDSWTGEIFSPCLRRDSWIGEIFSPCLLGRRDYFPEINIYF